MNWVDILIIVLVAGLGFMGWRNGVLRWIVTLGGGVVGVVLAGRVYTELAPAFSVVIDSEGGRQVAAFATIFVAVMAGAWLLSRVLRTALQLFMLGWVDNAAGLVLGAGAGILGATTLIIAMGALPVQSLGEAVEESAMATKLVDKVRVALTLLPEEFDQVKELLP